MEKGSHSQFFVERVGAAWVCGVGGPLTSSVFVKKLVGGSIALRALVANLDVGLPTLSYAQQKQD